MTKGGGNRGGRERCVGGDFNFIDFFFLSPSPNFSYAKFSLRI